MAIGVLEVASFDAVVGSCCHCVAFVMVPDLLEVVLAVWELVSRYCCLCASAGYREVMRWWWLVDGFLTALLA